MRRFALTLVRKTLAIFGWSVRRTDGGFDLGNRGGSGWALTRLSAKTVGHDLFDDIAKVVGPRPDPVIFDVGSNIGQSLHRFKALYPGARVYCFEPASEPYAVLLRQAEKYSAVVCHPFALGADNETKSLRIHDHAVMNSFLASGQQTWSRVVREEQVRIARLDDYCAANGIDFIDVLKIDTQGFDYEVLKGAAGMLSAGKIGAVCVEIIFSDLYRGSVGLTAIHGLLGENGMRPVSFYNLAHQGGAIAWMDGLYTKAPTA